MIIIKKALIFVRDVKSPYTEVKVSLIAIAVGLVMIVQLKDP